MGEVGGNDMRRSGDGKENIRADDRRRAGGDELKAELLQHRQINFACAVAFLCEDKYMLIGWIEVGQYGKLTHSALSRALFLNESLAAVTRQVEKIRWNDDTLAATLVLA